MEQPNFDWKTKISYKILSHLKESNFIYRRKDLSTVDQPHTPYSILNKRNKSSFPIIPIDTAKDKTGILRYPAISPKYNDHDLSSK